MQLANSFAGIIITTTSDHISLIALKSEMAKAKLVCGDLLYAHNTVAWEYYERAGSYPSANNIIHVVIFCRAHLENMLQIWSSPTNPASNYMKMTAKNVKSAWKVCVHFVYLLCIVFTVYRDTQQKARLTAFCGILITSFHSYNVTTHAAPSMMKMVMQLLRHVVLLFCMTHLSKWVA
jgi:hypothetical protein